MPAKPLTPGASAMNRPRAVPRLGALGGGVMYPRLNTVQQESAERSPQPQAFTHPFDTQTHALDATQTIPAHLAVAGRKPSLPTAAMTRAPAPGAPPDPAGLPAVGRNFAAEQQLMHTLGQYPPGAVNRFVGALHGERPTPAGWYGREELTRLLNRPGTGGGRPLVIPEELPRDPIAWRMFRESNRGLYAPVRVGPLVNVSHFDPRFATPAGAPGAASQPVYSTHLASQGDYANYPKPRGLAAIHEVEHSKQFRSSTPAAAHTPDALTPFPSPSNAFQPSWAELTPSLGDIPRIAEYARRKQQALGRPVTGLVDPAAGGSPQIRFPSGSTYDLEYMRRMAEQHGLFKGRSMAELLNTPPGRVWLRQAITGVGTPPATPPAQAQKTSAQKPAIPGVTNMNRPRWSQTPQSTPTVAGSRPTPALGGPAPPKPAPPVPYGFPQPTPAATTAQHAAVAAARPVTYNRYSSGTPAAPLAAVGGTALPVIHNQQAGRLEGARLAGVDGPVRDAGLLPEALEWSLGGKAVGLGAGVVRGGVRRLADALPAAARAPGDLPYFRRLLQARRAIPRLNYPPGGNVPRVTGGFRPTRGADVARDAALRFEEPVAARYGGYYNPASPPYLVVNRGVTPSAAGTARHEASHMLVDLARRGNAGFTPTPLHAAAARLGQSRVPFLRAAGNVADELAARQLEHKALLPRLGDQARYLFGGHPEYARVLGQISPAAGRLYRAAGYAPLVAAGSAGAGAATYGTRALAPYLPARRDAVTGLGALVQPPTAARDVDAE